MKSHVTGIILGAALCAPIAAFAGDTQTPTTSRRQPGAATIGARIRNGIHAGDLTRGEVRRLRYRIGQVRSEALALRADGLNSSERQHLRHAWRGLSRQLFRLRHNDVRRSGR